jgi:Tfp pilus assembly protein PilN
MIRINLLPHREEKRKARRQQFYVLLGLVSVLAAVIWFLGFSLINRETNLQNEKNEFLKREIASLDKENRRDQEDPGTDQRPARPQAGDRGTAGESYRDGALVQ